MRGRLDRLARVVLAAGLLAALAAGCHVHEYVQNGFKVGPNYGRPEAAVASDWIDAADVRVRKESDDHRRWWTVFRDPNLDALVCAAYEQNLTLREAGFRVLQAQAARAIAAGNLFPQSQFLGGGYSRNVISRNTFNAPARGGRYYSLWDADFNLAWEIDFWGRFRRAVEAADADLDASVEHYDDVLVALLAQVADAYVQVRTFQQRIAYVRQNIDLQRRTLKLAEARVKAGTRSELDVDQAQSNLAQTEALVPQLEIGLRQANNRLCVLLGVPPRDLAAKLGPGDIPSAPPAVCVGIPAELLVRRPDVRRAERLAAAQSARIGVAVSELYPHISVTGTVGFQAADFEDLFEGKSFQGSIGPSFQWNVLNYGRLVNNIRLQDARFQELVAVYQNTVLRANEEAEDGLVQFLRSQQQVRYLAQSVDAAEKAVKVVLARYEAGTEDFNRVALVEQNLVTQQDALAEARGEVASGLITIFRALGGGWQIRLDGCTPPPPHPPATVPANSEGKKAEKEPAPKPAAEPEPVRPTRLPVRRSRRESAPVDDTPALLTPPPVPGTLQGGQP